MTTILAGKLTLHVTCTHNGSFPLSCLLITNGVESIWAYVLWISSPPMVIGSILSDQQYLQDVTWPPCQMYIMR